MDSLPVRDKFGSTMQTLELLSMAVASLTAVRDLEGLATTLSEIMLRVIPIEFSAIYFRT